MDVPGDARAHCARARRRSRSASTATGGWRTSSSIALALDPGQAPGARADVERRALPRLRHHRSRAPAGASSGGCSRPTCSAAGASGRCRRDHAFYNPLSYHRGTVWAVEQATIVFGLRRFGFDARALDLADALFDLAQLYPEYRIPECVGGYARGEPAGAWRLSAREHAAALERHAHFRCIVQTLLGLLPIASTRHAGRRPGAADMAAGAGPARRPRRATRRPRCGSGATSTARRSGTSLHTQGTLHVVRQPPPESLSAHVGGSCRRRARVGGGTIRRQAR